MASAVVAATKVLINDGILENCREMGRYLQVRLEELRDRYSFVSQVRGRGLILGMELTIEGGDIVKKALSRGLIINCTVGKVLRFLPPLTVNREEIDEAVGILDGILSEQTKSS